MLILRQSLIANSCVVLLASLATGMVFQAWRRARNRVWQVHLMDLLTITLVLSLIGAWYFYAQQRSSVHERILRSSLGGVSLSDYQEGGVTWLRFWLGDKAFQFLDQPFGVTVNESGGWAQLEGLTSVRHVQA